MLCDSTQKLPELIELEELVARIAPFYCTFVRSILSEHRDLPSLVGESCSSSFYISVRHFNWPEDIRYVDLYPTTGGESVEVLHEGAADEQGRTEVFSEWGLELLEDGSAMTCVQLLCSRWYYISTCSLVL